ncbi:MAG: 16S rRNA (adenine(1518)-N(6)/adenine(1519)-N(6))-dimethyltransferase RsmA [Planctomycetota bacterium]
MTEPTGHQAQTLAEIRDLLAAHGLAPNKALGQNFLIDKNLVEKLCERARVSASETVFEVGPGTGTLTGQLLARGARVVAVELDRGLAELLRSRFAAEAEAGRFVLIEGDCLDRKSEVNREAVAVLGDGPFKLVANLPYHAATPLMLALMISHPGCVSMHATIQREVAERLAAAPGSKSYGSVSVVAACLMPARPFAGLPGECFWPRPKVASAMVELVRLERPLTDDPAALADFCRRCFAGRRKQLGVVLRAMGREPAVWPAGIDRTMRIEALSPTLIAALEEATRPR